MTILPDLTQELTPDLERAASRLWRKENPDKSVFSCDAAEKARYRKRILEGERS